MKGIGMKGSGGGSGSGLVPGMRFRETSAISFQADLLSTVHVITPGVDVLLKVYVVRKKPKRLKLIRRQPWHRMRLAKLCNLVKDDLIITWSGYVARRVDGIQISSDLRCLNCFPTIRF